MIGECSTDINYEHTQGLCATNKRNKVIYIGPANYVGQALITNADPTASSVQYRYHNPYPIKSDTTVHPDLTFLDQKH